MVFCTECGKRNPNGSKFCYNCGAKLIQDNVVEDINTSTNGSGNGNVNYQNTEKSLTRRNKPQNRSKHSLISILDAVTDISVYLFIVSLVSMFISFIIAFVDQQLFNTAISIIVISLILFIALIVISSTISDKLKGRLRQKVMRTGISAQAHILEVDNLEYDHVHGIRTAELTLEVDSERDTPYQVKSTVKVGVSDASLVFRPGSTVKVFVDPEDAGQVEVEY